MSMTRNLFNEIRPFFRLFDDVSRMHPAYPIVNRPFGRQFEPFLQQRHPSVDLTEHGNEYIIEAEVPGVKKENLNVRVGDGGRSISVEGQILSRTHSEPVENIDTATSQPDAQGETRVTESTDTPTQISAEREFVGSAHFSRTIWLPRPVDGSKVAGKLADGVLTLRVPKAEEKDSVKVEIR